MCIVKCYMNGNQESISHREQGGESRIFHKAPITSGDNCMNSGFARQKDSAYIINMYGHIAEYACMVFLSSGISPVTPS